MSGPGPQDPRGGAPPQRDEGDDLLSLAYGELGGVEERAVRARVASDPNLAARLGDIERVRSMFGAMEDEDPPPGLSAQLLAHAAQAARPAAREAARESARSGEGFWARLRAWLSPIAAHPGLAAAASIVLVAGVAGVLVARKGPDFGRGERLAAESAATAPAPELDRAPSGGDFAGGAVGGAAAPAEESGEVPAAETIAQNAALDEGAAGGQATPKADDAEEQKKLAARPSRRSREAAKPSPPADKTDPAPATGTVLGLRDGAESAKGTTAAERAEPAKQRSGKDTLSDEDAPGDAPAQAPAATTSPATTPPVAPPAPGSSRAVEPAPPGPSSPEELHKRAVAAASSRRCLEVQSIDRTIRNLDPKYSDSVFRADRRLATCLPAVKRAKRAK